MKQRESGAAWRHRLRFAVSDVFFGGCRGELTGRHRLLIQGCERILDYDERIIRLSVRDGEVREMVIRGGELRCQSYHPDAIVVVGEIGNIELIGKEGAYED